MKYEISKNHIIKFLTIGFVVVIFVLFGLKHYIVPISKDSSNNETSTDEDNLYKVLEKEKQDFTEYNQNSEYSSTIFLLNREYIILDAYIQKNLPNGLSGNNLRDTVKVEDGNIENDYSIVSVSYTLKNYSELNKLETPNNNQIRIQKDNKLIKMIEPVMMEPSLTDVSSSNHFHLELGSKEEKKITLFFCVQDVYLSDEYKKIFYLNPSGINETAICNPNDSIEMYIAKFNLDNILKKEGDS